MTWGGGGSGERARAVMVLSADELSDLVAAGDADGGPAPADRPAEVRERCRAERLASCVRLGLAEPEVLARLDGVAHAVRDARRPADVVLAALEGALSLTGTGMGNVQVLDPATGSLRIAAQCGFGQDFLDHFAVVDDDGSACGRAAAAGSQTVLADVAVDPGFAPHRAVAAAAGFRAVQSTPLVTAAGRLVGVVSTHFPDTHRPADRTLQVLRLYAELVAQAFTNEPRPQHTDPVSADPIAWAANIVFGGGPRAPGAPGASTARRRPPIPGGRIDAARRALALSVDELWSRYFALGGTVMRSEFEAYLRGLVHLDGGQQDVVVHAVDERAMELGRSPRWHWGDP